jgi:hypothetical protein
MEFGDVNVAATSSQKQRPLKKAGVLGCSILAPSAVLGAQTLLGR